MKPVKTYTAAEPREPTVEGEPAGKPAQGKGTSVDKADPYPTLRRRVLFAEKAEGKLT